MTPLGEDVFFLSVAELSRKLKAREISPVALAEGTLDRLERLGPKFGAVVTITRDRALAEAKAAERELAAGKWRGPLHGVPYGVKDLLATKGIPTTWGAEPYRTQVFDEDATAVKRLHDAGAVLIGKLAMVELAGGLGYNNADASFTGPGRTPWNTDFWSGGSSSGPGAATAAGLVGFSIGSETSGSILTPAAFSGVTGLRPTYGRELSLRCLRLGERAVARDRHDGPELRPEALEPVEGALGERDGRDFSRLELPRKLRDGKEEDVFAERSHQRPPGISAKKTTSGSSAFVSGTFFIASAPRRRPSSAFAISPSCSPDKCLPQRMRATSVRASATEDGASGVGTGVGAGVRDGEGAAWPRAVAAPASAGATAASARLFAKRRREGEGIESSICRLRQRSGFARIYLDSARAATVDRRGQPRVKPVPRAGRV